MTLRDLGELEPESQEEANLTHHEKAWPSCIHMNCRRFTLRFPGTLPPAGTLKVSGLEAIQAPTLVLNWARLGVPLLWKKYPPAPKILPNTNKELFIEQV